MKDTIQKTVLILSSYAMMLTVSANTEIVDGIVWSFSVNNGKATVCGASRSDQSGMPVSGEVVIPDTLGGCPVTSIEDYAFYHNTGLTKIDFPDCLLDIGYDAFSGCTSLKYLVFPASLEAVCNFHPPFSGCSGLQHVLFKGLPPSISGGNSFGFDHWYILRANGSQWLKSQEYYAGGVDNFYGYYNGSTMLATVISSSIRENDPTIMDVVYKVTSKKPTVKVRVLAFEDGERSFAKVVRPETFVTDTNGVETACNVGDNVTPNVEHTLSWRVSSDWTTKLAKVKFEVLACEGELLPLELMTIPASDQYGKMKISWNAISESQVLDALFWLYADKDSGLTLEDGKLKRASDGGILVRNDAVRFYNGNRVGYWYSNGKSYHEYEYQAHAPEYVFNKMGYSLLTGDPLAYANSETRLGLSPLNARQYAYKIVEE